MRTPSRPILFVLIAAVAPLIRSHAQFNNRYEYVFSNGITNSAKVLDIVETEPGSFCTLVQVDSIDFSGGTPSASTFICLKKLDESGMTIFDTHYHYDDTDYRLEPWRMVGADDGGFIVAGRAIKPGTTWNGLTYSRPFASRFDAAGVWQWTRTYESNQLPFRDSIQTSIVRVENDSTESYMIVRSGCSPDENYSNNIVINALKIDGTGNLLWNKRYYEGASYDGDFSMSDYPSTVVCVKDSVPSRYYYCIAGTRYIRDAYSGDTLMFFLGIDRQGSIVNQFTMLNLPGRPYNHDAIFDDDPGENNIVMSFSLQNSGISAPAVSGNRTQLGLLKMNRNYGISLLRYYWSDDSSMIDEAIRVKRIDSSAYTIGCNTYHTGNIRSIAMLQVQKNGIPQLYTRYNSGITSRLYAIQPFIRSDLSTVNIALGGTSNIAPAGNSYNARVISTDQYGNACGAILHDISYADTADEFTGLFYLAGTSHGQHGLQLTPVTETISEFNCDPGNPGYSRSSGTPGDSPVDSVPVQSGTPTARRTPSHVEGDAKANVTRMTVPF